MHNAISQFPCLLTNSVSLGQAEVLNWLRQVITRAACLFPIVTRVMCFSDFVIGVSSIEGQSVTPQIFVLELISCFIFRRVLQYSEQERLIDGCYLNSTGPD